MSTKKAPKKASRPAPDPDFTASVDSGLTESFEAYCTRLDSQPTARDKEPE